MCDYGHDDTLASVWAGVDKKICKLDLRLVLGAFCPGKSAAKSYLQYFFINPSPHRGRSVIMSIITHKAEMILSGLFAIRVNVRTGSVS